MTIKDINILLLCKWLWALGDGKDELWKRITIENCRVDKEGWYTVAGYGGQNVI